MKSSFQIQIDQFWSKGNQCKAGVKDKLSFEFILNIKRDMLFRLTSIDTELVHIMFRKGISPSFYRPASIQLQIFISWITCRYFANSNLIYSLYGEIGKPGVKWYLVFKYSKRISNRIKFLQKMHPKYFKIWLEVCKKKESNEFSNECSNIIKFLELISPSQVWILMLR